MELGERRKWEGGKKEGERNILFNSRRESLEDLAEIEVFFPEMKIQRRKVRKRRER